MIAIHTKFMPATDRRAAKIKAYSCNGHKAIVPIEYGLDDVGRHALAARKLIETQLEHQPDWAEMAYGGSSDGKGYTFCFLSSTVSMMVSSDE